MLRWNFMQRNTTFSRAIFIGLFLSVMTAQKGAAQTTAANAVASSPAPRVNENAAAVHPPTSTSSGNAVTGSVNPAAVSEKSDAKPSPAPFVEDFPSSDEYDIPRPHLALPVIVNSDSPNLDREVSRKDIVSVPDDYVIGQEDVLTVTIWKEHDLSGTLVVRPDGKITVPLVGEVYVVGMKPVDLQSTLEDKLKPFITVPQVAVTVNQINSRKIYLIGQVVREGTFPINSSMTVLQVLSSAGGLRDFAKRKKIYILRKQGSEEIRFPFDYDAAIHGRNREENIVVEPGDTIVVP
jgi:polysaccharide export outer membrane protein